MTDSTYDLGKQIKTPMHLGVVLRDIRKTQSKMRQADFFPKMLPKTVSAIENGNGACSTQSVFAMLNAMGYSIAIVKDDPKDPDYQNGEW